MTRRDRLNGTIGTNEEYRLPTDQEWSAAVGHARYPWGNYRPPPKGAGNYDPSFQVDDYEHSSPVGSFKPNHYGLYDMGGNVWQYCADWYRSEMNTKAVLARFRGLRDDEGGKAYRVMRGASWTISDPEILQSSYRGACSPDVKYIYYGFRCVLDTATFSR